MFMFIFMYRVVIIRVTLFRFTQSPFCLTYIDEIWYIRYMNMWNEITDTKQQFKAALQEEKVSDEELKIQIENTKLYLYIACVQFPFYLRKAYIQSVFSSSEETSIDCRQMKIYAFFSNNTSCFSQRHDILVIPTTRSHRNSSTENEDT